MVDLKRTKEELKEEASPTYDPSIYPASIYLSDKEVEKLGLDKYKVGDELAMVAKVRVSSSSENSTMKDGSNYSVTLELMEADISSKGKSQADTMFDNDE